MCGEWPEIAPSSLARCTFIASEFLEGTFTMVGDRAVDPSSLYLQLQDACSINIQCIAYFLQF